jgi:hypothetical protein
MAREPQRREQPRHLDAAIVPLERALLARAKAIEDTVGDLAEDVAATPEARALGIVAGQFRGLADELRYW